jgi:hypothetical protein
VLTSTNNKFDATTLPTKNLPLAIVATGTTGHYLDKQAESHCVDVQKTDTGPSIQVANGDNIETSTQVIVPLAAELSQLAKVGHIFYYLKSGSLISIRQLCGDERVALFTKYDVKMLKHGKVIITGKRNAKNGLWNIPLAPKDNFSPTIHPQPTNRPRHQANGAIQTLQTKQDLAGYLHSCHLSPL